MWENTNYRPQKKEKEKSFPGKYFLEIEERKTKHFLFDFPNEKKRHLCTISHVHRTGDVTHVKQTFLLSRIKIRME